MTNKSQYRQLVFGSNIIVDLDQLDEIVVQQIVADNPEVLNLLCEGYLANLIIHIYWQMQNKGLGTMQDAEDLAADTLLDVWETFDPKKGPLRGWIYKCAWYRMRRFWRGESGREARLKKLFEPNETMLADSLVLEKEELKKALGSLPRKQQELVILKAVEEVTFREIAELWGKAEGTVKSQYYRAIAVLRGKLDVN